MGRKYFVWLILPVIALVISCKQKGEMSLAVNNKSEQNKILQEADGTISLKVDNADCYNDLTNPGNNTAEWNVIVSKSGRFSVWLSSSTRDTTDLQYQNSVMVSLLDDRLEAQPECDRIIQNSSDVSYPYYRADSYVGQVYIQNPGEYNIQVISEKVFSKENLKENTTLKDQSRLLSVFFTPLTR